MGLSTDSRSQNRALGACEGASVGIAKNALCPCGSGEKYKRCCLSSGRFELQPGAPIEQVESLAAARLVADIDGLIETLVVHINEQLGASVHNAVMDDVYADEDDRPDGIEEAVLLAKSPGSDHVHDEHCSHDHGIGADLVHDEHCSHDHGTGADHVHDEHCSHDHGTGAEHVHGPGCSHHNHEVPAFSPDPGSQLVETYFSYLLFSRLWRPEDGLRKFTYSGSTYAQVALATRKPRLSQRNRDLIEALGRSHLSFFSIASSSDPDRVQAIDLMTGEEHLVFGFDQFKKLSQKEGILFARVVTHEGVSVFEGVAPALFDGSLGALLTRFKQAILDQWESQSPHLSAEEARRAEPLLCRFLVQLLEPQARN